VENGLCNNSLQWLWAFHVSILYLGGIFGAIFAAKVADHFGRRLTVLFFSYWTLAALSLNMFGLASFKSFEVVG
jgi:MFS family permease